MMDTHAAPVGLIGVLCIGCVLAEGGVGARDVQVGGGVAGVEGVGAGEFFYGFVVDAQHAVVASERQVQVSEVRVDGNGGLILADGFFVVG